VFVRLPEFDFIDDKEGKPIGTHSHIGRLDHSPDLPLSRQVRDAVDAQPGLEVPRSASFI